MDSENLIHKCLDILSDAQTVLAQENYFQTEQHLVKLRELLNSQPELEAGGAYESEESKKGQY